MQPDIYQQLVLSDSYSNMPTHWMNSDIKLREAANLHRREAETREWMNQYHLINQLIASALVLIKDT